MPQKRQLRPPPQAEVTTYFAALPEDLLHFTLKALKTSSFPRARKRYFEDLVKRQKNLDDEFIEREKQKNNYRPIRDFVQGQSHVRRRRKIQK